MVIKRTWLSLLMLETFPNALVLCAYSSTGEAELAQESSKSTGKAVLTQWSTIGALGYCASIVEYYRYTGEAVLEHSTTIKYSRVL